MYSFIFIFPVHAFFSGILIKALAAKCPDNCLCSKLCTGDNEIFWVGNASGCQPQLSQEWPNTHSVDKELWHVLVVGTNPNPIPPDILKRKSSVGGRVGWFSCPAKRSSLVWVVFKWFH